MSLRDFVTGSDGCAPSDGAGPSNALSRLAGSLFGGASKTQHHIQEVPAYLEPLAGQPQHEPAASLTPESVAKELAGNFGQTNGPPAPGLLVNSFIEEEQRRRTADGASAGTAAELGVHAPLFEEFERIYSQPQVGPGAAAGAVAPQGANLMMLEQFFKSFMEGARSRAGFAPARLPAVVLSVEEQCRIRDRCAILSRQLFAERGDAFADQQVGHLMHALNINPAQLPAELSHHAAAHLHSAWRETSLLREASAAADHAAAVAGAAAAHKLPGGAWVQEFEQLQLGGRQAGAPAVRWDEEFQAAESVADRWAGELQSQEGMSTEAQSPSPAAMDNSRRMAQVLAASMDPKMRKSQFLQFLSKMSNGQLLFQGNKVLEAEGTAGADLAARVAGQQQGNASDWVQEFSWQSGQAPEAAAQKELQAAWESLGAGVGAEFAPGEAAAEDLDAVWAQAMLDAGSDALYDQAWNEAPQQGARGVNTEYEMAADNPFLGDEAALQKGRELFSKGLLREAVLALEAEVQQRPDHAEAWRLLGTAHAENDDDVRAIAAMGRALKADPNNLDVLLALGVSHTNELDRAEAVSYLVRWLQQHPQHSSLAQHLGSDPPDDSQAQAHALSLFQQAIAAAPQDVDLHSALGVLHHLQRDYGSATGAFRQGIALKPQDYSLWNKLGATLANSAHSDQALAAYQRALSIKPNYMRAWTNMGISYANLGQYELSARYYVRALQLNPQANNVWAYLRSSLTCSGHFDLLRAVDAKDWASLAQALPLHTVASAT